MELFDGAVQRVSEVQTPQLDLERRPKGYVSTETYPRAPEIRAIRNKMTMKLEKTHRDAP
jgi:hypothetical protein